MSPQPRLLAAGVVLSIWTGLAQGWAMFGVLALWALAFCGICLSRSPLFDKAAVGLLMPCWLIFSQMGAVSSCGSGSFTDPYGHTHVEPTVCESVRLIIRHATSAHSDRLGVGRDHHAACARALLEVDRRPTTLVPSRQSPVDRRGARGQRHDRDIRSLPRRVLDRPERTLGLPSNDQCCRPPDHRLGPPLKIIRCADHRQ